MDSSRLRDLLDKYICHSITAAELDELLALLESDQITDQESSFYEKIIDNLRTDVLSDSSKKGIYNNIQKEIKRSKTRKHPFPTPILLKYAAAAAVIIISFFVFIGKNVNDNQVVDVDLKTTIEDQPIQMDSLPVLTFGDDDPLYAAISNKKSLADHGLIIKEDENGEIYYEVNNPVNEEMISDRIMTFSTPKGTTSKLILQDGTHIWLNSNSQVKYPVTFTPTERVISIAGEAYLKVKSDKKRPFIVKAADSEIKVLGTSFNVQAYKDDKQMKTTLIEGSVEISIKNQRINLSPGEQGIVSEDGKSIRKERVDIDEYISWRHGQYTFNDKTIKEILKSVQQWYDIDEIEFRNSDQAVYTGTLKRSKSLESLLKTLENISQHKFILQGRRLIVMK